MTYCIRVWRLYSLGFKVGKLSNQKSLCDGTVHKLHTLAKPGQKKNKCIYDRLFVVEGGFFVLPSFCFLPCHPSPSAFLLLFNRWADRKIAVCAYRCYDLFIRLYFRQYSSFDRRSSGFKSLHPLILENVQCLSMSAIYPTK